MKIIITNVYCYENRGDAGIVLAMIDKLRKIYKNPEIYLMSLWPEIDNGKYGKYVTVVKPVLPISKIKNKYLRALRNLTMINIKSFKYKFKLPLNKSEKLINSADIVISCGGGYMQCRNFKQYIDSFVYHYAQLSCAYFLKKKFIIFAQTVGPFDKKRIKLLTNIFNKAEYILPREQISFDYINRYFPNSNNRMTGDVAFLLKKSPIDIKISKTKKNIGITVRHWLYPGQDRSKKERSYLVALVGFITYLQESKDYDVYLMLQCVGPDTDDDTIITKELFDMLPSQDNIYILGKEMSPKQLKYLYSKMDYFVGTRMHSNIFSLAEEVPCLAISYDYKTDGIMKLFGLSNYVIDINNVNSKLLIGKFNDLVKDKDIHQTIHAKLVDIKANANENFEILKEIKK